MGVSIGILGGRVLAGGLADSFGWRTPLSAIAGMIAISTLLVVSIIPALPASGARIGWRNLLVAIPKAHANSPELLRATLVGCCWFAAFSDFWTALSLHLALPPFSRGATFAGTFGLIGIAGAIVARLAGRASDRWGARRVISVGLWSALLGFAILIMLGKDRARLALGALVMDAGCFCAHAATQGYILRTGGHERSRRYGAYMTVYWLAGALGSFAAPALFTIIGWTMLNVANTGLIVCGLALHGGAHHLDQA